MSVPHVLRHLHLPNITPFSKVSVLQDNLVHHFLKHKALVSSANPLHRLPPSPQPILLTFSPTPVYTTGRREIGTVSPSQIASLTEPLPSDHQKHTLASPNQNDHDDAQVAEVTPTLRGGQITFHGPGQLVIYTLLDLRSISSPSYPRGISPRCYVHLLEETTIRTLARWKVDGIRTENPGVWVNKDVKIAALGVHLRRNVASFGVGLNVTTDLRWFERITACGLEGKTTTSILNEWGAGGSMRDVGRGLQLGTVANDWAGEFANGLYGEKGIVENVTEEQVIDDIRVRALENDMGE